MIITAAIHFKLFRCMILTKQSLMLLKNLLLIMVIVIFGVSVATDPFPTVIE